MKTITVLFSALLIACLSCQSSARLPKDATTQLTAPTIPARVMSNLTAAPQMYTVCNSGGLRLREFAGTANKELAILPDGETVSRTSADAKYPAVYAWYEVATNDGLTGWVSSKYLCTK